MNIYFPVFGFEDDRVKCTKWLIQAESHNVALNLARAKFKEAPPEQIIYLTTNRSWCGPVVDVELIEFCNGIHVT